MRLEIPGTLGEPMMAARARDALAQMPGVRAVKVNVRSGRALLVIAPDDPDTVARVRRAVDRMVIGSAPPPPSIRRTLRRLRRSLRRALEARRRRRRADGHEAGAPYPWHADEAHEVARALETSLERGLDPKHAEAVLREVGPNLLAGVPRRTAWDIVAGQLFTVPTALLGGAMGLSLALGDVLEAGAILLVIGSNVVIGYFTEARAEELLDAWRELRTDRAAVLRGGREVTVDAAEIVPGDVLVLRAGQPIAADARIVAARDFAADESTLTGESEPVEKGTEPVAVETTLADRRCMVYAGTTAATGSARAVVVATGTNTEVGAIERALSEAHQRVAPLEQQLGALGRTLAGLSLAASVGVVGLGLLRGRPIGELLRGAVALGVAALPEGVPTVGTTALALASHRVRRSGIVIRRLAAAETLGAVSIVCADKTGTLTENRMRVAELWLPREGAARVAPRDRGVRLVRGDGTELPVERVHDLARIAALNADVDVTDAGEVTRGSGTEQALVEFAMAAGYPAPARRRQARRVREQRRSADVPIMITVHAHPELGVIELAKGAPEQLVERCAAMAPRVRDEALAANDAMASRALRVLAFAWRRDGRPDSTAPLTFAGLVGLRDPPRPGAREAIGTFAKAGIETLMLTGDQARTAAAIGRELGIARIQSRVTSTDKLAIVRGLQAEGRVVAMTGDGVNDGPALQVADVGVAMGTRGTSIARAVSDVVLATDDLPSLALAVREGRTLYDNVRRAIAYLVATNTSEVEVMLAGSLAGVAPLGPLQLLWLNVLTDVAPALVLAVEPSEPDVMLRPPRDPSVPIFARRDYRRLVARSAGMAASSLAAFTIGAARHGRGPAASTMAFASLVTSQLLHTYRCRAAGAQPNPKLSAVIGGSFVLQALALGVPAVRDLLGNAPLGAVDLGTAFMLGLLPTAGMPGPGWRAAFTAGEIAVERPSGRVARPARGIEAAEGAR